MELKFRDYQSEIIKKATDIFMYGYSNFVYLAMEVRTGKTLDCIRNLF